MAESIRLFARRVSFRRDCALRRHTELLVNLKLKAVVEVWAEGRGAGTSAWEPRVAVLASDAAAAWRLVVEAVEETVDLERERAIRVVGYTGRLRRVPGVAAHLCWAPADGQAAHVRGVG
jgi:hypothetical protein